MANTRFTVTVTEEQYNALLQIAGDSQLTMSGLVRMALDELTREPAVFLARALTHSQQQRYSKAAVGASR